VSGRRVEAEFVFGRYWAAELSAAYAILVPQRKARIPANHVEGRMPDDQRGDLCRVSSARQKKDQTIGSQTAALREHAAGGLIGAGIPHW
jgi:hypothetical protein